MPFTVIRTAEPGSLPLGAADGDADALADGAAVTVGDGDAPASVVPQAPRIRAATRAMAFTGPIVEPAWSPIIP